MPANFFNVLSGVPTPIDDSTLEYPYEIGIHFTGFIWIENIPQAVLDYIKFESSGFYTIVKTKDEASLLAGALFNQITAEDIQLETTEYEGEVSIPVPHNVSYVKSLTVVFYDTADRFLTKLFRLWIYSLWPDKMHTNDEYILASQKFLEKKESPFANIIAFTVNENLTKCLSAIGGIGLPTIISGDDLIFSRGQTEVYKVRQIFRGIFTQHSRFEKIVESKLLPLLRTPMLQLQLKNLLQKR